jgi:hypothetical protein
MMSDEENLNFEIASLVAAASAPPAPIRGRVKEALTMLNGDVLIEVWQYQKYHFSCDDRVIFTFFEPGNYKLQFSLRHTNERVDPADGYGSKALLSGFETTVSRRPTVQIIPQYRITLKQLITITRDNGVTDTKPFTDRVVSAF